jgi:diguanylate cyclase (GGDEF)-like protein/hemerythrin-like metal-binding protein/PAS domain S-box-containing protein
MNTLYGEGSRSAVDKSVADVFIWDSQFETGLAEVDRQHRNLVRLINELGRILATETRVDAFIHALFDVFDELVSYAEYHFRFEEDLMGQFHYDHQHELAHKQAHTEFVSKITEARAAATERPVQVSGNMLTYLSKWLLTHIVGTDMRMAKEILAIESGLPETEAERLAGAFMGDTASALLHAMNRLYDGLAMRTQDLLEAKRSLDQEVDERGEVETQLRKLSRAVEYSPVSIIITDASGEFEYVNPKFTQISGYTLGELKGKTPRILKSGNTSREIYEGMWAMLGTGQEWHGELYNRKKNGELHWNYVSISPVFDTDGTVTHYVSIQEDVTERRRAEEALQQQKRFSEDIVNSLPGIFYMLDVDGRFIRVNPRCMEVTGYSWAELERMTALDFFAADRNLVAAKMQEVFEQGDASIEAELVTRYGRRIPYYFTGHRTEIGGQSYLVGIGTDITERHALELELERQAHTDALTGLPNRRYFIEQAELELARAKRYGKLLSVLMLDLDEFKAVNDRYGHHLGDLVLLRVGEVCRNRLREFDVIGRIGGEEFAILLPETDVERAAEVAERLRQDIAAVEIQSAPGKLLAITASIGVATLTAMDVDVDRLLNFADQAMYQAKRNGRNRVYVSRDEGNGAE